MSTWINTMQCSESVLGGEVCALHCGNPRGKLLISFPADGTGARKSFTEGVELLPQRVERLISRVLIEVGYLPEERSVYPVRQYVIRHNSHNGSCESLFLPPFHRGKY